MSEPVEWRDRLFWEISRRHPVRPMVCTFHLRLDRAPDPTRLRARVAALVEAFPRLRQRIEICDGGPIWSEPAGGFSLDDHLRESEQRACADDAALVARLAANLHERLDPERPPWRLTLVREGDRHGLRLQWHHALSDGEGMLGLLGSLSDPLAEPSSERDLRALDRALHVDPRAELDIGTPARARTPGLLWNLARAGAGERDRRSVGSDRFRALPIFTTLDPEQLTGLREHYQVSTNELLVALASRAVMLHQQRRGQRPDLVRLLSRFSDRGDDHRVLLGNHSRALRLGIEQREATTMAELIATVRALSREQLQRGRAVPYGLYRLVFSLPWSLGDRLLAKIPPVIVNYGPWTAVARWIAGARIERIHVVPPMLPFHGCTFAIVGYRGELHGNLICDTELLADPELLVACLDEAAASATDALAARR